MKKTTGNSLLPSAERPLKELGLHIRAARQARGWTIAEAAVRAVMSPTTYKRIEAGDASVGMASWAGVLQQMQLLNQMVSAAAPTNDALGQAMRRDKAIKRVRKPKPKAGDDYDF